MSWLLKILEKEGGGYLLSRGRSIREPIHWGDMDYMRHVNNVVYLKRFESARINYLLQIEKRHLGTRDFLSGGEIGPIMRSATIQWKFPVAFPDTVSILNKVSKIGDDRFDLKSIMVAHKDGVLASRLEETLVTVDYTREPTGKVQIPAKWRDVLEQEVESQKDWKAEFGDDGLTSQYKLGL